MKRDMDLVREILLFSEKNCPDGKSIRVSAENFETSISNEQLYAHIQMLERVNLVKDEDKAMSYIYLGDLTWSGHEFLDSVRDPKIWKETKETAAKVGSFSIDILTEIAKGLIKTKIAKHTGVEI